MEWGQGLQVKPTGQLVNEPLDCCRVYKGSCAGDWQVGLFSSGGSKQFAAILCLRAFEPWLIKGPKDKLAE